MRISDILSKKQTFSFEIFPPKGELPVERAAEVARELARCEPDWISVTFSAGGSGNSGSTFEIAHALQQDVRVNALAHMTCMDAITADVDARIAALRGLGVRNVLALRGDRAPGRMTADFAHAADLIAYLRSVAPELCIGAACYAEGHVECDDFERSMRHLRLKQDAGADFLVSQLFFDNADFYRFRDACARHRVKIPVVAGIMPFTSVNQIQRMAFTCGASIPARVIRRLVAAGDDPAAQVRAGVEYACEQVRDLAANGVDGIHVYSMNKPEVGMALYDELLSCGYLAR